MLLQTIPQTYLEQAVPSHLSDSGSILAARYEDITWETRSALPVLFVTFSIRQLWSVPQTLSPLHTFFIHLPWHITSVSVYLLQELRVTFLSLVLTLKESDSPSPYKLPFHCPLAKSIYFLQTRLHTHTRNQLFHGAIAFMQCRSAAHLSSLLSPPHQYAQITFF